MSNPPVMYTFQWMDFQSKLSVAFQDLREAQDLFDVTLVCDGGQVKAHKVILAACSPHLRSVIKLNPDHHPLLNLTHIKLEYLVSMLDFMYNGEVTMVKDDIQSFLDAADELKVRGLYEDPTDIKNKIPIKKEPSDPTSTVITAPTPATPLSSSTPMGLAGSTAPGNTAGEIVSSVDTPVGQATMSLTPERFLDFMTILKGSATTMTTACAVGGKTPTEASHNNHKDDNGDNDNGDNDNGGKDDNDDDDMDKAILVVEPPGMPCHDLLMMPNTKKKSGSLLQKSCEVKVKRIALKRDMFEMRCKETFSRKTTSTHKEKKCPHNCGECGKVFPYRSFLKYHMVTHTGEKPYPCDECEKSFSWKSDLKRHMGACHMVTHTGKKPYPCDECEKSFSWKSSLKVHMMTHA